MDIVIQNNTDKPIYEQIYEQLSAQILKGEIAPGTCLPSIRIVAAEIGISVITVKKAWEMLEASDLIYTRIGKGCFVAEHAIHTLVDKRIALAEQRLKTDIGYYKSLGLSREELVTLIENLY